VPVPGLRPARQRQRLRARRALPAGPSCACNGGIQCHHHNLLKQDTRWTVRQNPGGSRTWTTPAGLTYTKPRKQYPT
jgi:hypothetical protein